MGIQAGRIRYLSEAYNTPKRFATYSYQLSQILALKPKNVLEIGIGNGLVAHMLIKNGIKVTTIDTDKTLNPDIVGSVTDTGLSDNSFEVVACFQVLEHLPFEMFHRSLEEIYRITNRYAVISLPDAQRFFSLAVHIPRIGIRSFMFDLPFIPKSVHKFDGEHYWEINKKGHPLKRIIDIMKNIGFKLDSTYRVFEWPYQRMFVLTVN